MDLGEPAQVLEASTISYLRRVLIHYLICWVVVLDSRWKDLNRPRDFSYILPLMIFWRFFFHRSMCRSSCRMSPLRFVWSLLVVAVDVYCRMERSKQTLRFQLYITIDDFLAFLLPLFDVLGVLQYVTPSIRVESTCC
ncbi:uncharacterized protein [Triticum aestivum]|uniref:uncharacterized protein n=1 Tax=Triticum aestivum TaxID=4565 RepID=UPI00098A693D|nr:uncharacterized protein LOC123053008 [Triticum aestivum]